MADLPRIENEEPVLTRQRVNSGAEGVDEFANFLGGVASAAGQEATKIAGEQSKAMYIHSVANIDQAKNDAQKAMLENPGHADKISRDMLELTDKVVQSSYVNKQDRLSLSKYAQDSVNAVNINAVRTNVDQSRRVAQFAHWNSWPDQLNAYKDALLSGDETKIKTIGDAMHSTLQSLVESRVLTPIQAGHGLNDMHLMHDIANDHLSLYGNPDASAMHYHAVNSHPLAKTDVTEGAPLDGNTKWLINYYNQDKSYQGAQHDIDNRMLPDPRVFDNLTPSDRQNLINRMHGVQIADGMTNSGMPFHQIESAVNFLNNSKNLNASQAATRNVLNDWIKKLKSGNYLDVAAQTPEGKSIVQNFMNTNAAIESSSVFTPEGKKKEMLRSQNSFVNSMVSWGQAHHIPSEFIQPIPKTDIDGIQSAFILHGDPDIALQTIGKYSKQNQAYVANAMKNPAQRMIVQAISYAGDGLTPTQKRDFIFSNQQGADDSNTKKVTRFEDIQAERGFNVKLKSAVSNRLSNEIRFLGNQHPFEDANLLQNGMIESTANYAKYLGQKNGDLSMNDMDKWVDQASQVYKKSHILRTGTNYVVNDPGLPEPLNDHQLDVLAFYATDSGANYVKDGYHPAEYLSASSRNSLKMIISSNHDLQAVDENGTTYFIRHWDANTYATAEAYYKKNHQESSRKIALEEYEKFGTMGLNARIPKLASEDKKVTKEEKPAEQPGFDQDENDIDKRGREKIKNARTAVKRRSAKMSLAIKGE